MSAVAGSLKYSTILETLGFEKGLNKISSLSIATGNLISSAIESATSAIIDLGKQSISALADYEQLSGGIESMFGGVEKGAEQINKVIEKSQNAWKDLTMSQNDYYRTFTATYPLMKNDIEDQNEAIEQTNRLMTLESDLANTFGYSVEQASTAINWALKGSFNYLDNLNIGIKGTQEGFLEAAHNVGYMVNDVKELTSSQILDILEKTANEYGVLGKTATEASGTISGSLNMVKASFENVLSGTGTVDTLIDSIVILGENLIPAIEKMAPNLINGIVRLFEALIPKLPGIIQTLLPVVLDGIISLFNGIVQALPELITMILDLLPGIMEGIILLVQEIANQLPIIVTTISEMLPELIPILVDGILQIIPILLENLPLFIKAGYQLMIGLIEGLINSIPSLIEGLFNIRKHMKDFFKQMPQMFVEIGGNLIKGLWNGISNVTQWLFNKIKGFCSGVVDKIKGFFGIHSPSKLMEEEIGDDLILGVGVSFKDNGDLIKKDIDKFGNDIFEEMQKAVNATTGEISTNASVAANFGNNGVVVVNAKFEGTVDMDSRQVGRIVTPVVTQTLKQGGAY